MKDDSRSSSSEVTAEIAVGLVAWSLAAYMERCGSCPGRWSWCATFLRRAAIACGASEECVRRCASAAQRVAAIGERGPDEDFVVLCTPDRALRDKAGRLEDSERAEVARLTRRVAQLAIAGGYYDAPARAVLKSVLAASHLSWRTTVGQAELEARSSSRGDDDDDGEPVEHPRVDEVDERRRVPWMRVSLAAVGGGAILALSGGVAAPSLAASIAATVSLGADGLASCITGVFGVVGAGVSGFKARRRFAPDGDFALVPLRAPPRGVASFVLVPGFSQPDRDPADAWGGHRPRLACRATGDLVKEDDYELVEPPEDEYDWWDDHAPHGSASFVVWEQASLQRLYQTMRETSIKIEAQHRAARGLIDELLRRSALGAASLPLALLEYANALDDPWAIAIHRSKAAGLKLADQLATPGHRPVTLVGYSIGARVVMHCLDELAKRAEQHSHDKLEPSPAACVVENAILLGAPVAARPTRWRRARTVVAGRLVNGFSRRDWMLRLVYRSKAWSFAGVAGAQEVLDAPTLENLDLTDLVNGHLTYPHVMQEVFARLDLDNNAPFMHSSKAANTTSSFTSFTGGDADTILVAPDAQPAS
ncbi:hypothetical protein CTAYLR_001992 [Chrysophaeum taylorii]|uniref:Uncharacterized protein n=1 Tax=Chrysophaeum taylorii TaxID=2483200 RepID=A0AAD7U8J6_9STRA|nr:hypothetical protein CTAYLR_001992 [Chrysophaeum taylorii]